MSISFIYAMAEGRVIGVNNQLPWHLPADLAFFKQTTMHHPILMGRKTYESIGKPLPGRTNIIMTTNRQYEAPGCQIVNSIEEVLEAYANQELFVIGGAKIYEMLLPYAQRMYVTEIAANFHGDTFFPEVNSEQWQEVWRKPGPRDERNPYDYEFVLYERR